MLRVTVKRAGAGALGAASLLTIGNATGGCAMDAATPQTTESTAQATSAATVPMTADLSLGYAYDLDGATNAEFLVQNPAGTDEFVRPGQSLRVRVTQYYLWRYIYPNDYWNDDSRLDQLSVSVKVEHLFHGAPVGAPIVVAMTGFETPQPYGNKEAVLAPFTVRDGADSLRFTLVITDAAAPSARAEIGYPVLPPVAVFGGDGPNKTLLFDSTGGQPGATLRSRVLDGGNLTAGGVLSLGYTHFRADVVANVQGISYANTVIGQQRNYGRGGPVVVDIIGKVVHEITAGVQFDDGTGWRPETAMLANARSRERSEVFPQQTFYSWGGVYGLQTTYELALRVPEAAKKASVYFHVKTYLVADYSGVSEVTAKSYKDGQRILLRESYDNPSGSGTNFDFAVDPPAAPASSVARTVIFIKGITQPGQDMFMRGGIDHDIGLSSLGFACTSSNYSCAIPIRHRNTKNPTSGAWKRADGFLDWYGAEASQLLVPPGVPAGSPADWTTNAWPTSWGYPRSETIDGYGVEPLNTFGPQYWMLDVDMDCARVYLGGDGKRWFEVKSFISGGPGWEPNVSQSGTPYPSSNHVAQCGKINVFERGSNGAWVYDF